MSWSHTPNMAVLFGVSCSRYERYFFPLANDVDGIPPPFSMASIKHV